MLRVDAMIKSTDLFFVPPRLSRDRKIFGLMLDCPLCYSTLYFPFIRSQQWPVVRIHRCPNV
jgi:hypothetical protein